jgi:hypothetical protein
MCLVVLLTPFSTSSQVHWPANICFDNNHEREHHCNGGAKFLKCDLKQVPVGVQKALSMHVVHVTETRRIKLDSIAAKLIDRTECEFYKHGALANDNQLLAVALNLFTTQVGVVKLDWLNKHLETKTGNA